MTVVYSARVTSEQLARGAFDSSVPYEKAYRQLLARNCVDRARVDRWELVEELPLVPLKKKTTG